MGSARVGVVRLLEATVALALFVAVAPVVLIAAAVSAAHFRVWPFFTHKRVGLNEADVSVTKIRTLPPCTGTHVDKYELRSVSVPKPMQRLRKLHLDELPQLLGVVAGRLTFVGPRPEMRNLHETFSRSFAAERTSVRPGLTGLWQISDHVVGLIGESPEYDRFYVQNRSARLDVWILYRTVVKVFAGRTITLDDVPRWAFPARDRRTVPATSGASSAGG